MSQYNIECIFKPRHVAVLAIGFGLCAWGNRKAVGVGRTGRCLRTGIRFGDVVG